MTDEGKAMKPNEGKAMKSDEGKAMKPDEVKTMIKPENYYVVQGWMVTDLKLSGISLQVYAIIHGFSQDGKSVFNGGHEYLAEWCNCSDKQITRVLRALLKKGLITRTTTMVHNRNGFAYVVTGDKMSGDKMSGEKMSGEKMSGEKMSGDKMSLHGGQNVGCQGTKCPVTGDKMSNEMPFQPYEHKGLPAPYNKDINKDIKKEKKEEGEATPAPTAFSSSRKPFSLCPEGDEIRDSSRKPFSLCPEGDEIPDLDIPCEDGITMYFTESDIQELKRGYIGVNIVAEIRKMQLQAKQVGKIYSLDRTRRRVHPWLQNVQNTLGANMPIPTKVYTIDPADPDNKPKHKPTHEEFLAGLSPEDRQLYLDNFPEAANDR